MKVRIKDMEIIHDPKFAYFMGFFAADGSYYKDGRSGRFEFSDGSSTAEELRYSKKFLNNIKNIIKILLNIDTPGLRKKGNKYVLQFRNKGMETLFKDKFGIKPGPKTLTFEIPLIYKDNKLEKFFWLGVMDGDGMVARESRKIALEMVNRKLIYSFNEFLKRNNIKTVLWESSSIHKTRNESFKVTINAPFFGKYKELLGFYHPRKRLWLEKHDKSKHMFVENELNSKNFILNGKLDYSKIFDSNRIFIVNGKSLLEKHGIKINGRKNIKFLEILNLLRKEGYLKEDILNILKAQRWKMSKGSINSVRLPLYFNKKIIDIARVVRLRDDSISLSRTYNRSVGLETTKLIKTIEEVFDIKPKYTKKKEPIFCSGVLEHLFSKIIKRNTRRYKLPEWHKELIC